MKKQLIIFDFDGVIVASMQLSYSINKSVVPDLRYKEWQGWFEGNLYENIRKEFIGDSADNDFVTKYNAGLMFLKPISGISKIIKELSNKYVLTIISSASQATINDYLEKNRLKKYFSEVLGMETAKSKIDKFQIILEQFHIKPDETLIVTDTIGDIKEAKEIRIKSLGVTWGVHSEKNLRRVNPDFIATQPTEIINGINQVLGAR